MLIETKTFYFYELSRRLWCHEPQVFGCLHLGKNVKKKKKKSLLWRVWYWTRLLVVFLCLYHSPTAHSTGPVDSWIFVFVDPSYTHTRAYMGSNKTPWIVTKWNKIPGHYVFGSASLVFTGLSGVAVKMRRCFCCCLCLTCVCVWGRRGPRFEPHCWNTKGVNSDGDSCQL